MVSEFWQPEGLQHTLLLYDHDVPIAGGTMIVHGKDVVAGVIYADPKYDWHGVMYKIIDCSFHWASSMGYERIDLGGSYDYKARWAPEYGEKIKFDVYPSTS